MLAWLSLLSLPADLKFEFEFTELEIWMGKVDPHMNLVFVRDRGALIEIGSDLAVPLGLSPLGLDHLNLQILNRVPLPVLVSPDEPPSSLPFEMPR